MLAARTQKQKSKAEKTTPKNYFDMMSSTVLLQLSFYLQKFFFYYAKTNHSKHE